ncbi:hypothetical protein KUV73_14205 [Mameliella alba]|nr:hypothetical protein [Mameliella alba]MBY6170508.1 hypothetical protein [Mameliella alba]MBY6175526.1 hypothetical protein [Mameliella alba]
MAKTKITTCCYCGTRAALVLKGQIRHELSCAACGAPLHNMKKLKVEEAPDPYADRKKARKVPAAVAGALPPRKARKSTHKKKKPKKGLAYRFFDEAFDLLEDIFD